MDEQSNMDADLDSSATSSFCLPAVAETYRIVCNVAESGAHETAD